MQESVFDVLQQRGFIGQLTHEEEIKQLLKEEKVTFYIGFDPTADSLHVGHFIQIMVMAYMQRYGHRPIALIGGGTTMVGDPSGRTDMRKMMSLEQIQANGEKFKEVFKKFLDFSDDKAIMVNNADWLLPLNYIEFLRDIGSCFSVNKMLTAECYKNRLENGLSFLEFNYMIMQSYDFLMLYKNYGCTMQFGGNDQWNNILGGVDLIRRKCSGSAYGMTFNLLVNSEGKKMGKTEKGALWLDKEKTSPYEFYQYWRNVGDDDVENCLKLLTFLPMEEVNRLAALKGSEINEAKKVLAYEVTNIIHGEEEAKASQSAAEALFGQGADDAGMPTTEIAFDKVEKGMDIISILIEANLASSKSDAKRLIDQGGVAVNGDKIESVGVIISLDNFDEGKLIIKKGKKIYHKVTIKY
ncbi:MAG: tyrosine--tRNA ligase [Eubacteriaceae bacterium]|nr:tyrosine--tRNA ligase [Eubacteriaceae bacterium]